MVSPTDQRHDFVPTASILAFVFIGIFFLIGLIGRCLALNQSTIRSAQSSDLMIYRAPPRANPAQPRIRPSMDLLNEPADHREQRTSSDEPAPVQRGPKK